MRALRIVSLVSLGCVVFGAHAVVAGETLKLGRTRVAGSFNYGLTSKYTLAVRDLYPVDLDNDGNEEIIMAGFESQPNTPETFQKTLIRIFGWKNGRLVNQTSKWLPGDAAVVEGVGDVAIGDFNGDGRKDFFTTAYTDMDNPVYEYSFINKGGYFDKIPYQASIVQHGSTVADMNHDGFDDVIVTGYRVEPYLLGSPTGLVRYEPMSPHFGSDLAAGHFLSPTEWSFIETDSYGTVVGSDNALRSLTQYGPNEYSFDFVSNLPVSAMGQASHDVRAIAFKLNNDDLDDAIVFSREWGQGTTWPEHSTVQLLLNRGSGQFEDVTATKLIGYQTNTTVSYHPVVVDINADGFLDIFISGPDWDTPANSTALLMGRGDGVLAERFRSELSRRSGGVGSTSTLVKTKWGYFIVSEQQNPDGRFKPGKARVTYTSISVR